MPRSGALGLIRPHTADGPIPPTDQKVGGSNPSERAAEVLVRSAEEAERAPLQWLVSNIFLTTPSSARGPAPALAIPAVVLVELDTVLLELLGEATGRSGQQPVRHVTTLRPDTVGDSSRLRLGTFSSRGGPRRVRRPVSGCPPCGP